MKFRETNFKRAIKNLFYPKRQNVVVLEPHLGLGDGIICLGLVRELSKRNPQIKYYYACLHRCYQSLAWMFQDLDNVFLFAVESGREARQLAGFLNAAYLPVGIHNVDVKRFDEFFYEQHQLDFDLRWINGYVPPGPRSNELFELLNPNAEPYILVCNRESGLISYELDISNLQGKKVITLDSLTNNIFDWTKLVLNADEIHSIDTAFVHMIESIFYKNQPPPLFYYKVRETMGEFTRRLAWKIISTK